MPQLQIPKLQVAPTSLTLKALIVMALTFYFVLFNDMSETEAAKTAEALAAAIFTLASIAGTLGYRRRVAKDSDPEAQALFGTLRKWPEEVKLIALQAAMAAASAAIRRIQGDPDDPPLGGVVRR